MVQLPTVDTVKEYLAPNQYTPMGIISTILFWFFAIIAAVGILGLAGAILWGAAGGTF